MRHLHKMEASHLAFRKTRARCHLVVLLAVGRHAEHSSSRHCGRGRLQATAAAVHADVVGVCCRHAGPALEQCELHALLHSVALALTILTLNSMRNHELLAHDKRLAM